MGGFEDWINKFIFSKMPPTLREEIDSQIAIAWDQCEANFLARRHGREDLINTGLSLAEMQTKLGIEIVDAEDLRDKLC